jgi:hypothetical protein
MGLTVLYVAFGVVALWLLGEVLLQYKARLRWRLLAFVGFLTVVLGVLLASQVVIALGALAFAVGQTYVTLSFRKGFSTGWAIGGRPGASRRRKSAKEAAGPSLEVSGVEEAETAFARQSSSGEREEPTVPQRDAGYDREPMPDDTGQYGVFDDSAYGAASARPGGAGPQYGHYDGAFDGFHAGQRPAEDAQAGQYDYGNGPQQYAAYSDPYVGGQQYPGPQDYEGYDGFGGQEQYRTGSYQGQQPYPETPPGGVWVPHQRDPEHPAQERSQHGTEADSNEQQQYRY